MSLLLAFSVLIPSSIESCLFTKSLTKDVYSIWLSITVRCLSRRSRAFFTMPSVKKQVLRYCDAYIQWQIGLRSRHSTAMIINTASFSKNLLNLSVLRDTSVRQNAMYLRIINNKIVTSNLYFLLIFMRYKIIKATTNSIGIEQYSFTITQILFDSMYLFSQSIPSV